VTLDTSGSSFDTLLAVYTNSTVTNIALTNAGYYSVMVSNNYGSQMSVLAVLNVVPSTQTAAFVPTWSKGVGSLFFLSVNNTERGLGYNPVNGHLIVVSRTPTNGVHVLDAATGKPRGLVWKDCQWDDPVEFVRWLRNVAAHPGRLVREDPRLKMDEPAYRNAYGVVRAVFAHTHTVIQALD